MNESRFLIMKPVKMKVFSVGLNWVENVILFVIQKTCMKHVIYVGYDAI